MRNATLLPTEISEWKLRHEQLREVQRDPVSQRLNRCASPKLDPRGLGVET